MGDEIEKKEPIYTELISENDIKERVMELGREISDDYDDSDPVVLIGVLTGATIFQADLAREISLEKLEIDNIAISSYDGTQSSRIPRILKDLTHPIEGKHVIICEDIVDTGYSMAKLLEILMTRGALSVRICALLSKPERREIDIPIHYLGFEIPDKWVEGYGLDSDGKGRNRKNIVVVNF